MRKISGFAVLLLLGLVAAVGAAQGAPRQAGSECQVTQPNGYRPPSAADRPTIGRAYGSGPLGVALPGAPVQAIKVRGASYVQTKFGWYAPSDKKPTITGRRLDGSAPAAFARSDLVGDAYGEFYATIHYFPTRGCWEITGSIEGSSLTFVVEVADGPESWMPPIAPAAHARVWGGKNITFEWGRGACRTFDVAAKRGRSNWRTVRAKTSDTSYTIFGAVRGASYALRLRCYDDFGGGDWQAAGTARLP